ncbi:MAG TPA: polyprenol monophosphomannose synthase [Spirochaetota bacterium]|nr:polyprenol monophosphomannose synthase [Spirochaetota bacterium]
METAIVIPTYNEKNNIKELIKKIFTYCKKCHIFIVDDNSPDGTGREVLKLARSNKKIHLVKRKKKEGIGKAYIHGFRHVLAYQPSYIIQMDADLSHPPAKIPELLTQIKKNDIVIGSRYIHGISVINWPLTRILLSYFAGIYVRFFTGIKIKDTTGGFKCYKRRVLQNINLDKIKSDGYSFQIEMNYIISRFGYKIKEIPFVFYDRHLGSSKMSTAIFIEALLRVPFLRFTFIKKYFKKYSRKK